MSHFLTSSLGKKYIMAITGVLLVLFTIGHMLGNLQIFLPPEVINKYAHTLQSLGLMLWIIRAGLLTVFVVHVITGISLSLANKKARPVEYVKPDTVKATLASRTMLVTGIMLLAFIVFHIMHFTLHLTDPSFASLKTPEGGTDVHRMMITGFLDLKTSSIYLVGMIVLMMHLYHGATSWFQSMGINNPKYNCFIKMVGPVLALIVFVGNSSIPAAVLMKWLK